MNDRPLYLHQIGTARAALVDLIEKVNAGYDVVLTRDGQPVIRLAPANDVRIEKTIRRVPTETHS